MSEYWLERAHAALRAAGLRSGGGRELVLEELAAAGCLRSAQEPADGSGDHHHHTVCDRCGRVLTFADDELEAAIDRISDRLPFAVDRHDVVLRGACADCAGRA